MLIALLFFLELFLLFILSRSLSRAVSFFLYTVTKNYKLTVYFMAFIFFPGTVVHEISHALMASLLFVRVHKMEFIPKIDNNTVKLGSVSIDKSNIFKILLIGMAPFLFGSAILIGSFILGASYHLFGYPFFTIFMGYVAFEIGNTMFSSKKDMEGALELIIAVSIILIVLYFVGFRIPEINIITFLQSPLAVTVFQKGSFFLSIPLIIDAIIIVLIRLTFRKKL